MYSHLLLAVSTDSWVINKRVITDVYMKFELIRSWDALAALSDQWNDLLCRSEMDTIFLRWEWVCAWKQTYAGEVSPFVLTVRDDSNQLVSLVPLYKVDYKLCNLVKYTILRVMADSASGSEYPAWIISKKHDNDEMYDSIVNELESYSTEWDCIWMSGVRASGGLQEKICRSVKKKYYLNTRKNNSSAINLINCKEVFLKLISRNMRSQLRRDEKKVLAHGEISIKKCVNEQEIPVYLDALYKLHDIRWKKKGLVGLFERKPEEVEFYKIFTALALKNDWLRLYALYQEGSIKAVQLGYTYDNKYNQLQEGFNPRYSSGAGNVLRLHVLETCISENVSEYDFLGGHTEHKRRWGSSEITGYDLFIGKKSFRSLILFIGRVWPTGRLLKAVNQI